MPDDKTKRVPSLNLRKHLAAYNLEGVSRERLRAAHRALKDSSDQVIKIAGAEAHAKIVAALRELVHGANGDVL